SCSRRAAGAMPQLNFADFAPQLFWLAVTFVLLYLAMSRLALPRVAGVLEGRARKLSDDLAKAEKLKAQADEAMVAYNKALADARGQAQAELQQAAQAIATANAERGAALDKALAEKTRAAEHRIDSAKQAALADIRGIAVDSAVAMVAKLIGSAPSPRQAGAAVDAAIEKFR